MKLRSPRARRARALWLSRKRMLELKVDEDRYKMIDLQKHVAQVAVDVAAEGLVLPVVASTPARCGGPWRHPPPCDTASSVSGCEGARLSLPRVSSRPLASSCSRTAASTTRGGTTGLGSGVEQIPPMSIGGARDATKGRRGVGLGANPCPSVRVC